MPMCSLDVIVQSYEHLSSRALNGPTIDRVPTDIALRYLTYDRVTHDKISRDRDYDLTAIYV